MANMEERLQAVVSQAEADGEKWHIIIHGNNATTVPTENGNVPTVAKQMKDVHDEVVNGVIDYMTWLFKQKMKRSLLKTKLTQLKAMSLRLEMKPKVLKISRKRYLIISQQRQARLFRPFKLREQLR